MIEFLSINETLPKHTSCLALHDNFAKTMINYIFFTFAPVQGFIEKSRKLRDLYGSSLILSKLSEGVADLAKNDNNLTLVSPALIGVQEESRSGFPNRILFQVNITTEAELESYTKQIKDQFFEEWQHIINECNQWIKNKPPLWNWCEEISWQDWDREWKHWKNYAWETFSGTGKTVDEAIRDLENRKLSRNWTAINWIGESSSLSGADGIVFPKLGHPKRKPKLGQWGKEKEEIKKFYKRLSLATEGKNPAHDSAESEGKYIDPDEKLSIPELVKRLVTLEEVSQPLNIPSLKRFTELVRRAQDNKESPDVGQWTGWFMGDGDRVGDYLTELINSSNDQEQVSNRIGNFSQQMRNWGEQFQREFDPDFGRIIYAGGDDFLGLIYNRQFPERSQESISGSEILKWLIQLPDEWKKGKSEAIQKITLSLGFVWAAPAVPQRDVLQHCREAQRESKKKGRDRVTIRVVFSQGRYVEWTTPWQYLKILQKYEDRDGEKNWNHIYSDLSQLQARHAFGLGLDEKGTELPEILLDSINQEAMLEFVELYFPSYRKQLEWAASSDNGLFPYFTSQERPLAMVRWLRNFIAVGWHLCSEEE
jgi:CRISPR-associated protein Cmr2